MRDDVGVVVKKINYLVILEKAVASLELKEKKCIFIPCWTKDAKTEEPKVRYWLSVNVPNWKKVKIDSCGKFGDSSLVLEHRRRGMRLLRSGRREWGALLALGFLLGRR